MNRLLIFGVLAMVPIFIVFPANTFIFSDTTKLSIYQQLMIWKFSVFELWVFGLFYIFLLSRLYSSRGNSAKLVSLGPLKPFVWFTIAGLFLGIIGTIRNHGNVNFGQIRYFCEGILLYLIILNLDLRRVELKKYVTGLVGFAALNAVYYLIAYLRGSGVYWQGLGYIVTGHGDILEMYALASFFMLSALASSDRPTNNTRWKHLLTLTLLTLTTASIVLSLRRSLIAMYIIGFVIILSFSKIPLKLKICATCVLFLCGITIGSMSKAKSSPLLSKIDSRFASINVIKYHDDESSDDLTSSTGHVSEVINGWNSVKANMFTGIGFGVEIQKIVGWTGEPFLIHNELLFYWVLMGVFGPFMFVSMYWIPFKYSYKRLKTGSFQRDQCLHLTVMSFVTAKVILGGTFYPPMSVNLSESYIYFILLGFAMNTSLAAARSVRNGE